MSSRPDGLRGEHGMPAPDPQPQQPQQPGRTRHLRAVPDTAVEAGWADAATREYRGQPGAPGADAAGVGRAADATASAAGLARAEETLVDGGTGGWQRAGWAGSHAGVGHDADPARLGQPRLAVPAVPPGQGAAAPDPAWPVQGAHPGEPWQQPFTSGSGEQPILPEWAGQRPAAGAAAGVPPSPPVEGVMAPPMRRVGMPWPRRPYELLPPSPDLLDEIPRRPDMELDPAERSAVAALRWAVVRRLTEISVNHVDAAWRLRYSKPVGPHVMALLFAVPVTDQGPLRFELRADVRTWHHSDRVADAAAVLQEMARLVFRSWRQPGFDVRSALTNQPDQLWTPQELQRGPEFLGVALSTLDTSEYGLWKRAQGRARSSHEVPSEVLVQFADGGRLRIMRHAGRQYDRIERQASLSLTPDGQPPLMLWQFTAALNTIWHTHPAAYTWHFLAELTRTIYWGWPSWR